VNSSSHILIADLMVPELAEQPWIPVAAEPSALKRGVALGMILSSSVLTGMFIGINWVGPYLSNLL
jgi:predicted MFS family arabinose efflux permease